MTSFTVITCTYNAAGVIGTTMESIASQTYPHVEHIVQDGESSDDTLRIVRIYPRVKVVSEPDSGLYDAMNKAIKRATGDYLVFINAGDRLYSSTTLEEIARQIDRFKPSERPAVVYGNTNIVDGRGNYLGPRHLSPPETLTWKSFRRGMLVCHQAFYVRTDIAREIEYNVNYRLSADVDWCIRVMKRAAEMHLPLHNTHLILCDYLAGGMSKQNHRKSLMERFRIMSRHYGLLTTIFMHLTFLFRK
jgi:glycosyltransferase involved in cell wall biosynthesis